MNKKIIAGILIMVMAVFLLFFILGVGGMNIATSDSAPDKKNIYECSVTVDENLFGQGLNIEDYSCENTGRRCGLTFGLFKAEGSVEMWDDGGMIASKNFKTGLFTGKEKLSLSGCTDGTGLKIRVYDDNHNLEDEKII